MPAQASHRYARIAPRKCRLVADLIRGRNYEEAANFLQFTENKAARLMEKVLHSAYHNATHNQDLPGHRLVVSRVWVDEAGGSGIHGKLKRFRPRAQGRATQILRRASHIHIELDERHN